MEMKSQLSTPSQSNMKTLNHKKLPRRHKKILEMISQIIETLIIKNIKYNKTIILIRFPLQVCKSSFLNPLARRKNQIQ